MIKCSGCESVAPLYNPIAVMQGMSGQVVRVHCHCGKIIVAQPAQRIEVPDAAMVRSALKKDRPLIVKP